MTGLCLWDRVRTRNTFSSEWFLNLNLNEEMEALRGAATCPGDLALELEAGPLIKTWVS